MPAFTADNKWYRADPWQGLDKVVRIKRSAQDRFIYVFKSPEYSIRAFLRIISRYENDYNLKTWTDFFSRWDPVASGTAQTYNAKWFKKTFQGKEFAQLTTKDWPKFIAMINKMEAGYSWVSEDAIAKGIALFKTSWPKDYQDALSAIIPATSNLQNWVEENEDVKVSTKVLKEIQIIAKSAEKIRGIFKGT
jgi:hypothetical protein